MHALGRFRLRRRRRAAGAVFGPSFLQRGRRLLARLEIVVVELGTSFVDAATSAPPPGRFQPFPQCRQRFGRSWKPGPHRPKRSSASPRQGGPVFLDFACRPASLPCRGSSLSRSEGPRRGRRPTTSPAARVRPSAERRHWPGPAAGLIFAFCPLRRPRASLQRDRRREAVLPSARKGEAQPPPPPPSNESQLSRRRLAQADRISSAHRTDATIRPSADKANGQMPPSAVPCHRPCLPVSRVPEFDDAVVEADGHVRPSGEKANGQGPDGPASGSSSLPFRHVPDAHRAVRTGRGQRLAVRRERHRPDDLGVADVASARLPVSASKTRSTRAEGMASFLPSGENATDQPDDTTPSWKSSLPRATSQTLTTPSPPTEATSLPSGVTATALT